ncbi:hypothetical protein [Phaffia rhodozyma]|uniref:Uncharacterized protein n=1 Tax=Phaffia rhodozyma TaxID=264483 RepID=A0A0F7SSI9_PHARH|nr:hypothetical protein [Phaffia rhodozyma]
MEDECLEMEMEVTTGELGKQSSSASIGMGGLSLSERLAKAAATAASPNSTPPSPSAPSSPSSSTPPSKRTSAQPTQSSSGSSEPEASSSDPASKDEATSSSSTEPAAAPTAFATSTANPASHSQSSSFHLPTISIPHSLPSFSSFRRSTSKPPSSSAAPQELAAISSSTSSSALDESAEGRGRSLNPQASTFFPSTSLGSTATSSLKQVILSSSSENTPEAVPQVTDPKKIPLPASPKDVVLPLPDIEEQAWLNGQEGAVQEDLTEEKIGQSEIKPGDDNGDGTEVTQEVPEPTTLAIESEDNIGRDQGQSQPEVVEAPTGEKDAVEKLPVQDDLEKVSLKNKVENLEAELNKLKSNASKVNKVLQEMTPLENMDDSEALEDHLRNLSTKVEMSMSEIRRVNDLVKRELSICLLFFFTMFSHSHNLCSCLPVQESRTEELRDTHSMESTSQSNLIESLRSELSTLKVSHTTLQATHRTTQTELSTSQTTCKEEEEKRLKAISLLKTVRQKLVKADKDKEELNSGKEELKLAITKAETEAKKELDRWKLAVERGKQEREKDVRTLREKFESEVKSLREGFERDSKSRKEEGELKAITADANHAKKVQTLKSRISSLEEMNGTLTEEKSSLFSQLQERQAELEKTSSQALESLSKLNDLEFRLREGSDKIALLEDELHVSSSSFSIPGLSIGNGEKVSVLPTPAGSRRGSGASLLDLQRQITSLTSSYESKLSDLRSQLHRLEASRAETEEEWSRNVQERSAEVDRLRGVLEAKEREYEEAVRGRRGRDEKVGELERVVDELGAELGREKRRGKEIGDKVGKIMEEEASAREEIKDFTTKVESLYSSLNDSKAQIQALRQTNRTLKDELRKVQSSAFLLEKQRNPGVGYWSHQSNGSVSRYSLDGNESRPPTPSKVVADEGGSIEGETGGGEEQAKKKKKGEPNQQEEEEVNLEYLRNETRRLVAGVS